jgi:Ca2+-dependent lipid-binding protein
MVSYIQEYIEQYKFSLAIRVYNSALRSFVTIRRLIFPDSERAAWFNMFVAAAWPHFCKDQEPRLRSTLSKLLSTKKPSRLLSLEVSQLRLGSVPPEVVAVKAYRP